MERGELLEGLQTAVALEDYAAAMRIKRQLDAVDDADPLVALKKRLQQAVANERYEVRLFCMSICRTKPCCMHASCCPLDAPRHSQHGAGSAHVTIMG